MITLFAKCVKQLGFYTSKTALIGFTAFAKCVKQLGFYTKKHNHNLEC